MPDSSQPHRPRQFISRDEWELYRSKIYKIYVEENNTLSQTMRIMEEMHRFKASARKYKMKLKEWKFEKYVRAADMKIVVAKATERARQDGRETAFYNAGQPLSAERIGNFKKRIALDEEEWISSSAETPPNITYHTPRPENNSDMLEGVETGIGCPIQNLGLSSLVVNPASQLGITIVDDLASLHLEQSSFGERKTLGMVECSMDAFFGYQPDDATLYEHVAKTAIDAVSEFSVHEAAHLARSHEAEGNLEEAATEYIRIVDVYAQGDGDSEELLRVYYRLAGIYQAQAELEKAAAIYRRVVAGSEKIFGESALETLLALYGLAKVLEQQGQDNEAESLYRQAVKGFKNLGLVEYQMDCQFYLADLLRDKGLHRPAVRLLRSTLSGYQVLDLRHRMIGVLGSLLDSYFQMDWPIDFTFAMSAMQKLLGEGLEMDHNLFPEYLIEGIHLATIQSPSDFRAADSVFLSVLPKLELLSDAKYSLEKFYAYLEIGLHYKRHEKWEKAAEYLHLASESPVNQKGNDFAMTRFVNIHLIEAQMQIKFYDSRRAQKELREKNFIEFIQSNHGNGRHSQHAKDGRPGVCDEGDDGESNVNTDTTSCKYGLTYSVSDITGISDSRFMVP